MGCGEGGRVRQWHATAQGTAFQEGCELRVQPSRHARENPPGCSISHSLRHPRVSPAEGITQCSLCPVTHLLPVRLEVRLPHKGLEGGHATRRSSQRDEGEGSASHAKCWALLHCPLSTQKTRERKQHPPHPSCHLCTSQHVYMDCKCWEAGMRNSKAARRRCSCGVSRVQRAAAPRRASPLRTGGTSSASLSRAPPCACSACRCP